MKPKISEENLYKSLFDFYENFKEQKLGSDFIKHSSIIELAGYWSNNKSIRIESIGKSIENKNIYSFALGNGAIKILAWSQMHGDEPTATAAIFDIIKFFCSNDDFNDFRINLLENLSILFIPMLNPDGAAKYRRENILNIDINRDALRRQSDESNILWEYANKFNPDFGFNLHDQNSYYTAGNSNNPSAISLLAPPMNHAKSINYIREKSMQVICKIQEALQIFIPNKIARYKDDFEPRSFGDNFVKNGISSILIESGFYLGDSKKDFVRKLNFIALLSGFNSIAKKYYVDVDYKNYFDLPENKELLLDLVLRNITVNFNGRKIIIDIGIKREKHLDTETAQFSYTSKIAEIGDLSTFYGIEEEDVLGGELKSNYVPSIDDPADFIIYKDGKIDVEILNGFIRI